MTDQELDETWQEIKRQSNISLEEMEAYISPKLPLTKLQIIELLLKKYGVICVWNENESEKL